MLLYILASIPAAAIVFAIGLRVGWITAPTKERNLR